MEDFLGIPYKVAQRATGTTYSCPSDVKIVRYADDFVIMCETEEKANSMFEQLQPYLKIRGLELAPDKTKVTHIRDGFDFLGFQIRRYSTQQGSKLLIKPSSKSIKSTKTKIHDTFKMNKGSNVGTLISALNPQLIGTANYWKSVVAKQLFSNMNTQVWFHTKKFLIGLHSKKSWEWIRKRYFNQTRRDKVKIIGF